MFYLFKRNPKNLIFGFAFTVSGLVLFPVFSIENGVLLLIAKVFLACSLLAIGASYLRKAFPFSEGKLKHYSLKPALDDLNIIPDDRAEKRGFVVSKQDNFKFLRFLRAKALVENTAPNLFKSERDVNRFISSYNDVLSVIFIYLRKYRRSNLKSRSLKSVSISDYYNKLPRHAISLIDDSFEDNCLLVKCIDYNDNLMTNYAVGKTFTCFDKILMDTKQYMPITESDNKFRLASLPLSAMANGIDIVALFITSDNQVISSSLINRLVPLDWSLLNFKVETNFSSVMEAALSKHVCFTASVDRAHFLGYSCSVLNAGKPNFVYLCKLRQTAAELIILAKIFAKKLKIKDLDVESLFSSLDEFKEEKARTEETALIKTYSDEVMEFWEK